MTFSPVPRPDPAASIVGGLLGGLTVAASLLAFFVVHDPRERRAPGGSLAELRVTVAELGVQTGELRARLASHELAHVTPTTVSAVAVPPMRSLPPGLERAVACPGENRCTLDRTYLAELLADPSALAGQARIMPSVRDGVVRGLKLYGIRPGSLPRLLGYRNGDLLLSVNGLPLIGADAAMTTFSRLRRADTLAVELERKGERMIMTCDIR
ncbi:hypothetical protein [Nannocystis sp.]|uniref:hypothetical protein n=1 Tax=Nannocystis sp. TaxID=1962667 RepID=UPI0024205D21|nr:hypothetical protein [Nannocystis sp.]MBK7829035.1 hypothetical protein [Nannocystis sp.]MBK9757570.1 hypothetical protein [Nannocystis sp.]